MHHAITQISLDQINESEPGWDYTKIKCSNGTKNFTVNVIGNGYLRAYKQMELAYNELMRKINETPGLGDKPRIQICELEGKLLKNLKVQLRGKLITNGDLVVSY
ncbi:MAG: hypothetical protein AABX96_04870 [Nanoarchaeota archaeon]